MKNVKSLFKYWNRSISSGVKGQKKLKDILKLSPIMPNKASPVSKPKEGFNLGEKTLPSTATTNDISENQLAQKPIITIKQANTFGDVWESLAEDLKYMSHPVIKRENLKKWETFFTSQSRPLPDINRAINNSPDSVYKDYFNDLKGEFNEKQILFAIKNMYLQYDPTAAMRHFDLYKELFSRATSSGFDFLSKTNLIMLMEVLHCLNLKENFVWTPSTLESYADSQLKINTVINRSIDGIRVLAPLFSKQEYLFILKVLLDKNVFDIYLVRRFFELHSPTQLENMLDELSYKITYFNQEVKLNATLMYIIDQFISFETMTGNLSDPGEGQKDMSMSMSSKKKKQKINEAREPSTFDKLIKIIPKLLEKVKDSLIFVVHGECKIRQNLFTGPL